MSELVYPKIYFIRVQLSIPDKNILETVRGYLNKAIRIRDRKPKGYKYYPDTYSPLSIQSLIEPKEWSKNVIISGIDQPYSFIRLALKRVMIGDRLIHIKEPDFGIPRGRDGTYPSFYDRQFLDALLEGCGMRKQPIKLFTDDFWYKMVGINPKEAKKLLTHTITINQKTDNVKINDFIKISQLGVLQYSFQRATDGSGELSTYILDVEFEFRLGACQGQFYLLGIKQSDGDYPLSKEEQMATRGKGFGVNGSLLDIAAVMKEYQYIPFKMLDKDIWIQRKVDREWNSYCVFCGNLYTLLGFHPDLTWIAATCKCSVNESIHAWKGDNGFFRLVLSYDYMNNRDRDIFDFNSQPLNLMIKGLTPMYSSIQEFKDSAYVTQVVEQAVVYRNLASKFKLATVENVSDDLQTKELSKVPLANGKIPTEFLYNVRFSMPVQVEGGLWTIENRPSIYKVVLVPKSASTTGDHPTAKEMDFWSSECVEGKLDRIMNIEANHDQGIQARTVVDIRVWLPEGVTFSEQSEFFLVPRPPTSYITSLEKAIDRWYLYLLQRENVTIPERTHITRADPVVVETSSTVMKSCSQDDDDISKGEDHDHDEETKLKEKQAFVPGSAHVVKFVVEQNFVTDGFQQFHSSPSYHFGVIFFNTSELNDTKNTFNGVLQKVEDPKRPDKKVIVTAIMKCNVKDLVLDSAIAVSMWSECEDEHLKNEIKIDSDWDFFRMIRPCPLNSLMDLRDFLLYPTVPRVHHFKRPTSERKIKVTELYNYAHFNTSQAEGAANVLNYPLVCLQGPPGCGKTDTLARIIHEIFNQQAAKEGMVIIVCPTNHACSVVNKMMKKIQSSQLKQLKVRRLMAYGKELETSDAEASEYVHSSILNHPAYHSRPDVKKLIDDKKTATRNLLSEDQEEIIKSHLNQVRNLVLDDTGVLICTVNTANNDIVQNYFHGDRKESKQCLGVAVDESNLVAVPQMLGLLGLNPKYFALIGDHHQLSKFYNSKSAMNANAQTCMMRFLTATDYMKQKGGPTTLLRIQYRYPDDLCQLISAWSYCDLLVSALSIINREYGDFPNPGFYAKFPALKKGSVLRVVYDESSAREKKDAFSYVNAKEVQIIVNLVNDIVDSGILQEKITVLSMYMSHLKNIREALGTELSRVAVCTVDSYEGQEQSIVILSTVRCNAESDIGFLREGARLNVGLSRTMDYLFYVSAEETFKKCQLRQIEHLYQLMDNLKIPKITK